MAAPEKKLSTDSAGPAASWRQSAWPVAKVAGIYVLLGGLGLLLAVPPGFASPVFPAAGFALAIALFGGRGLLGGIWLGSLLLHLGIPYSHDFDLNSILIAVSIASGATLQAWVGGKLIRDWAKDRWQRLEHERDVVLTLGIGGPLACLVSATCGIATLVIGGIVPLASFGYDWWSWYVGDTLGVLTTTPLALGFLNERDPFWRKRFKSMLIPVVGTLAVTSATFLGAARWEAERQANDLEAYGRVLEDLLEQRFIAHREALAGLARFVEINPDLGHEDFKRLVSPSLGEQSDIYALSFSQLVKADERAAFEARMAREMPDRHFEITERDADGRLVRAGNRPEYVSVAYIEPAERNRSALGYDTLSEPFRRDAHERARRTGRASATAPIHLVQANQHHRDILIVMPVHKSGQTANEAQVELHGFAVAVLRVDELIENAMHGHREAGVDVEVRDLGAPADLALLYRSEATGHSDVGPLWKTTLNMADREWELRLIPSDAYLAQHRPWIAWAVGAAGMLFTAMLQTLLLGITGRAALVQRRVDEQMLEIRTKSQALAKSEERYRSVVANIREVIFQTDADGRWRLLNPAWTDLTGHAIEDSLGTSFADYVLAEDQPDCAAMMTALIERQRGFWRNQVRFMHRDGGVRWVEFFARPVVDELGVVVGLAGSLNDITERRQAEASLRASELALNQAQAVAGLGSWEYDIGRDALTLSAEAYRIYGIPAMLPVSLNALFARIPQEDHPRVVAAWEAALAGTPYEIEHRIVNDDQPLWVRQRAEIRFDSQGKAIHALGTVLDISHAKKLAQDLEAHRNQLDELVKARTGELSEAQEALVVAEAKYRGLVESPMAGIYISENGRFRYVNPALAQMHGFDSPESMLAHGATLSLVAAEDRERMRRHVELIREGKQPGPIEFTGLRCDGTTIALEAYAVPARFEGRPAISGVVIDVTERRSMIERLQQARAAAEAANEAKSSFLANMSHEIRTPLHAISGMAHLIRREPLTAQQGERLDKLLAAGEHLGGVINAILELSKIEAGKFELMSEEFDMHDLFKRVGDMLHDRLHAKHIELRSEIALDNAYFVGDVTRLQQALLNYANNAVKFTDHGHVVLRVSADEDNVHDTLLRFEVEDSGIGIHPDVLTRLFNAFEQADNSNTRKYGGTGLGLIITKKLAELMGGSAGASSLPGKGSVFWFTARVAKGHGRVSEPPPPGEAEAALARLHAGRRILLVEDEPINREIALLYLEDVGLQADTADNGATAVELAGSGRHDLILMDMKMPEMDGLEATRRIRQRQDLAHLPIIALTANVFAEDRERCLAVGMDDFLAKPLRAEVLYDALLKWLTNGRGA